METGGTRRFARATPLLGQALPEWCGLGLARMSEADGCNGRNNSVRVNVSGVARRETIGARHVTTSAVGASLARAVIIR